MAHSWYEDITKLDADGEVLLLCKVCHITYKEHMTMIKHESLLVGDCAAVLASRNDPPLSPP